MQEEALETVLRRLEAAGIFGEAKPCGEEYYAIPCPFAKWKHKNGEDNRPSATVSFGEGRSVLRCHSCGMKANLEKAVAMLNDLHGGTSSALTAEVVKIEKEQGISIKPRHKKEKPPNDHLEILRPMLKTKFTAQAKQLFARKNVPLIVAKKFYCAYVKEYEYPRKKRPIGVKNAILFPMLAKIGDKLICPGAQVRPLDAGPDDLKYYTLFPFKPASARFLFGEHLLHMARRKKIFLVEGALDAMHIWSEKHKAFALFGLYISTERAKKIKAAGARKVYILLDPDQNEEETPFKAQENLRNQGVEAEVLHSEVDPSQLTKEDLDNF
jgi:5S rRNA maturation endonuclease (ribonuclease M5)